MYILSSSYFENQGDNTFTIHELPFDAQISAVFDIAVDDFNNDTYPDLLLVGNTTEISTQLGRLDALNGLILLNDQNGAFRSAEHTSFNVSGNARSIEKCRLNDENYYIVARNNDTPVFLKKEE